MGVYTIPLDSIVSRRTVATETGINCCNILEYTQNNNTFFYVSDSYVLIGIFEPESPGFTVYTAPVHAGLLFVSRKKRSDFGSAARTGLQWHNVNNTPIGYKNHYAPM